MCNEMRALFDLYFHAKNSETQIAFYNWLQEGLRRSGILFRHRVLVYFEWQTTIWDHLLKANSLMTSLSITPALTRIKLNKPIPLPPFQSPTQESCHVSPWSRRQRVMNKRMFSKKSWTNWQIGMGMGANGRWGVLHLTLLSSPNLCVSLSSASQLSTCHGYR